MAFVSVTRLRLRSVRFLPAFLLHTTRSLLQVRHAPGFATGATLADRKWAFWTLTVWDSEESMRAYMTAGAHKEAMRHLLDWCDEGSMAHWTQEEATLPAWADASARMRQCGRISKVRNPSPQHASMSFNDPRTTMVAPIHKA